LDNDDYVAIFAKPWPFAFVLLFVVKMLKKARDSSSESNKSFVSLAGYSSYHEYFVHRTTEQPFPSLRVNSVTMDQFTADYIQVTGLETPILIPKHDVTFLKFPMEKNVYECFDYVVSMIGPSTMVKVINVARQQDESMSIEEYKNIFTESQTKAATETSQVYNLISLELSLSSLSTRIIGPQAIRQIDWIDQVWPIDRVMKGDYPRVQKYCLISMAGSYTDFHIDFGGTNVWYHVVKGTNPSRQPDTDVNYELVNVHRIKSILHDSSDCREPEAL
jgi:hypothetical protein